MQFNLTISTDNAKEFAKLSSALAEALGQSAQAPAMVRQPYERKLTPVLTAPEAPVGVPEKMREAKKAGKAAVIPPPAAAAVEDDLSDYDEDLDFGDDAEEDERPPVTATVPASVKKKKAKPAVAPAPAAEEDDEEDDELDELPEEPKRGRGRPPKAGSVPKGTKAEKFDLDRDLVPAFKAFFAANGRDAAKAVLAEFEVASIRDIAPTEFAAIMRKLRPKAA